MASPRYTRTYGGSSSSIDMLCPEMAYLCTRRKTGDTRDDPTDTVGKYSALPQRVVSVDSKLLTSSS